MRPQIIKYIAFAILIVLVQVLMLSNINLNGWEFYLSAMPYIAIILFMPFDQNRILAIIIGFVIGITIDFFMNSHGINASACVLLAFAKPSISKRIFGEDAENSMLSNRFNRKLLVYTFIGALIHHFWFFLIETFYLSELFSVLTRTFLSSIITTLCVFIAHSFILRKISYE